MEEICEAETNVWVGPRKAEVAVAINFEETFDGENDDDCWFPFG
jgi:hypothetical protein